MSRVIHADNQCDRVSANSRTTLTAFVEGAYLPWTKQERRASTSKGHHEIWINHIREHVGDIHLREFRTVDASRMLRAIAAKSNLTKTTLQHIKSVLSTIFTYAKNEGAFDGANPVDGVLIPRHAKEPGETHAYDLNQVLQILDRLPLLEKSLVATAALAGLRQGELRGLEWTDYTGTELVIKRSIWMSVVNLPKTRASRDSVPVIPALAEILDEYRKSMGNPETGVVFHCGDGTGGGDAHMTALNMARDAALAELTAGKELQGVSSETNHCAACTSVSSEFLLLRASPSILGFRQYSISRVEVRSARASEGGDSPDTCSCRPLPN